jgi:antitoxin VapB
METAKVFANGASQAVRLPKKYRFSDSEVYVKKVSNVVYLFPKTDLWETFIEGVQGFSEDFMEEGRDQGVERSRAAL